MNFLCWYSWLFSWTTSENLYSGKPCKFCVQLTDSLPVMSINKILTHKLPLLKTAGSQIKTLPWIQIDCRPSACWTWIKMLKRHLFQSTEIQFILCYIMDRIESMFSFQIAPTPTRSARVINKQKPLNSIIETFCLPPILIGGIYKSEHIWPIRIEKDKSFWNAKLIMPAAATIARTHKPTDIECFPCPLIWERWLSCRKYKPITCINLNTISWIAVDWFPPTHFHYHRIWNVADLTEALIKN